MCLKMAWKMSLDYLWLTIFGEIVRRFNGRLFRKDDPSTETGTNRYPLHGPLNAAIAEWAAYKARGGNAELFHVVLSRTNYRICPSSHPLTATLKWIFIGALSPRKIYKKILNRKLPLSPREVSDHFRARVFLYLLLSFSSRMLL